MVVGISISRRSSARGVAIGLLAIGLKGRRWLLHVGLPRIVGSIMGVWRRWDCVIITRRRRALEAIIIGCMAGGAGIGVIAKRVAALMVEAIVITMRVCGGARATIGASADGVLG